MILPTNGIWKTGTPMPEPKANFGCAVTGRKVYCVGCASGFTNGAIQLTDAVYTYDLDQDSWELCTRVPESCIGCGVVAVSGKLYCFGGAYTAINGVRRVRNNVDIYDTATATWSMGKPMLQVGHSFGCTDWQGKIYCAGGCNASPSIVRTMQIYDVAADSWQTGPDMPQSQYSVAAAVSNGKLYISGTHAVNGIDNSIFSYDLGTGTWRTELGSHKGTPSAQAGVAAADDRLFVLGGYTSMSNLQPPAACFEAYALQDKLWSVYPDMPTARYQLRAIIDGSRLIAIGGVTEYEAAITDTVEIYTLHDEGGSGSNALNCCCGKMRLEIELPISNNLDTLAEVKDLVQMILLPCSTSILAVVWVSFFISCWSPYFFIHLRNIIGPERFTCINGLSPV